MTDRIDLTELRQIAEAAVQSGWHDHRVDELTVLAVLRYVDWLQIAVGVAADHFERSGMFDIARRYRELLEKGAVR